MLRWRSSAPGASVGVATPSTHSMGRVADQPFPATSFHCYLPACNILQGPWWLANNTAARKPWQVGLAKAIAWQPG